MASYVVIPKKCEACGGCLADCATDAISLGIDGRAIIDTKKCTDCGLCATLCPFRAIRKRPLPKPD